MDHVLDYGWGRPDPSHIKARHFAGVLRYLCDTRGRTGTKKKLTRKELEGLVVGANVAVGVVWQEADAAMVGGGQAGRDEGKRAAEAAAALGVPKGAGIYFAADHESVTVEHAVAYLEGAGKHLGGYRLGLYGGYDVVTGVREQRPELVSFFWQTLAWSRGLVAKDIHLYQCCFGLTFEGVEVDLNDVLEDDWGQFTTLTSLTSR